MRPSCGKGSQVYSSQKITFRELREMGLSGVLIYCSDYKCSHYIKASADPWPDETRLSDIERRFVCEKCGTRGADVRPDHTTTSYFKPIETIFHPKVWPAGSADIAGVPMAKER